MKAYILYLDNKYHVYLYQPPMSFATCATWYRERVVDDGAEKFPLRFNSSSGEVWLVVTYPGPDGDEVEESLLIHAICGRGVEMLPVAELVRLALGVEEGFQFRITEKN